MAWVATAVVGGTIVSGVMSSNAQKDAASSASSAQIASTEAGIAEQKRQFEAIQALLKPYVDAGGGALTGQKDLLGLNGTRQQQAAMDAITASPEFAAMTKQGENSILQNASATGGLRGGNTQAALAQFRPQLLAQLINDRFAKLGGLTSIGQNAAAGTGNAGMQTGNNVTQLLQQQGAALAGNALAQGQATANMWNNVGGAIGNVAMLKAMKVF